MKQNNYTHFTTLNTNKPTINLDFLTTTNKISPEFSTYLSNLWFLIIILDWSILYSMLIIYQSKKNLKQELVKFNERITSKICISLMNYYKIYLQSKDPPTYLKTENK